MNFAQSLYNHKPQAASDKWVIVFKPSLEYLEPIRILAGNF